MQLCERCGVELPDDAAYCRQCGRRTLSSWASAQTPAQTAPASTTGNACSTLAVFFGVVGMLYVVVGVVAVVLAGLARYRQEPSSGFALVVAGIGAVVGAVVQFLILGSA
ncbi:MAG TPA: zinc-ribbon domain-containing protein [Acidimicrobiales bacterium]